MIMHMSYTRTGACEKGPAWVARSDIAAAASTNKTPKGEQVPETHVCAGCKTTYATYRVVCPRCGLDNPWH